MTVRATRYNEHEMKGEKLFEKLKDRKIIKEGMTTQVLTGILPSTGEADLINFQTGLTGDGGVDYGESGVNDSTLTGEGFKELPEGVILKLNFKTRRWNKVGQFKHDSPFSFI